MGVTVALPVMMVVTTSPLTVRVKVSTVSMTDASVAELVEDELVMEVCEVVLSVVLVELSVVLVGSEEVVEGSEEVVVDCCSDVELSTVDDSVDDSVELSVVVEDVTGAIKILLEDWTNDDEKVVGGKDEEGA